jgi:uncharacterized protein YndB with AHSA1/START domain
MDQQIANPTSVERKSDREFAVTRLFDAPPRLVFKAWSDAKLFQRWWVPKSVAAVRLVACDMDVRTGGKYRLEFGMGDQTMAFFGKYLDVVPDERIVWTNDEGEEGAVTTVTFEGQGEQTLVTFSELYPTKEAADEALQGSAAGLPEQFEQLSELLATADA